MVCDNQWGWPEQRLLWHYYFLVHAMTHERETFFLFSQEASGKRLLFIGLPHVCHFCNYLQVVASGKITILSWPTDPINDTSTACRSLLQNVTGTSVWMPRHHHDWRQLLPILNHAMRACFMQKRMWHFEKLYFLEMSGAVIGMCQEDSHCHSTFYYASQCWLYKQHLCVKLFNHK